jgi:hypothetical protein
MDPKRRTAVADHSSPDDVGTRPAKGKKIHPGRVFGLCPVRHVLLLAGLAVIGAFYLLRGDQSLMEALSAGFTRPFHRLAGRVSAAAGFSLAELCYVLLILAVLAYLIRAAVLMVRGRERAARCYKTAVSLLTAGVLLYAGFCMLWNVCYYGESFSDRIGLTERPVSPEDLEAVTAWFAGLANEYAAKVPRDGDGLFAASLSSLLDRSQTLYSVIETEYTELAGPSLRIKPMLFSKFMSEINFTGFFFPFTGEANLNVDSPRCLLPATIAHELSHQRGVAEEDEANFVAIISCLADGDPDFVYSAALLAYIHLGNALYDSDYEAWLSVYESLDDGPMADLRSNNEYWEKYETKAAEVSENVYDSFLQSNGQEKGIKSYGACVDLLVAYYMDTAKQGKNSNTGH